MSDSLNNLEADRNFYEISLLKLQNELEVAKANLIHGVNIRKGPPRYHMGMDVGSDPPSGFAYLENLRHVIIPNLQDRISQKEENIERLTSRIESLTLGAVPVAEAAAAAAADMTQGSHSTSAVSSKKLRSNSSSSSEGEGRKKRRRNNRRKSHRRKSHRRKSHRRKSRRERTHKHHTRRKRRKSRKYH